MDLADIASAIAARYSTGVSAPTGYTALQTVSHLLPATIGKTPALYVHTPTLPQLELSGSRRHGQADFPVRFYYSTAESPQDVTTALYAWWDVLIDRLLGQLMLGEGATSNAVSTAKVASGRIGWIPWGFGEEGYPGIELTVEVRFSHAVTIAA